MANSKSGFICLLTCLHILISCNSQPKPCAYKGGKLDYLAEINCAADYTALQSVPLKNNYSNVQSIKIVYELATDKIYYTQSKKYKFHYAFCSEYLKAYDELSEFNKIEYGNTEARLYAICNLNYFPSSKIYAIDFFPDDKIDANNVAKVFTKIKNTTYFGKQVKIISNSWNTNSWTSIATNNFISVNDLYKGQTYQALQLGITYGYLKFVDSSFNKDKTILQNDIVVLNKLPNNLPICAATITSVFQTPLCHINVLAQNRNTPNCMLKNIFENATIKQWENKLIQLEVKQDTCIIKLADTTLANLFLQTKKAKKIISLQCDESIKQLIPIAALSNKKTILVGGKAANMGELAKVQFDGGVIPIPEKAFAIPFYFYKQHLRENGVDKIIQDFLNNNTKADNAIVAKQLSIIRDAIEKAPLSPVLYKMVAQFIGADSATNFRFRSSTNAEDIADFNGAGLYDSKTGNLTNAKKSIDKAIKQVWASAWNDRAFAERAYFNLDQNAVAMGILVHKAFGTEDANGVVISRNLYRKDYPAFTINVQVGETSVVQPDAAILPEQFLVNFSGFVTGNFNDIAVDYIAHSSLLQNGTVMTKDEIILLAKYVMAVKKHFWKIMPKRNTNFENFALDVEFKLEAKTRRVVLKQVRLY